MRLTLTGFPAYHCVVPSFSYWTVLNFLEATQFRSKDARWNITYVANSWPFHTIANLMCMRKYCQNLESEIRSRSRVFAPLKLSIPKDCIVLITVFHVAWVLTQRRRETTRWRWSHLYVLTAMFLESMWKLRNLDRNAEFATLSTSPVGAYCIVLYFLY